MTMLADLEGTANKLLTKFSGARSKNRCFGNTPWGTNRGQLFLGAWVFVFCCYVFFVVGVGLRILCVFNVLLSSMAD